MLTFDEREDRAARAIYRAQTGEPCHGSLTLMPRLREQAHAALREAGIDELLRFVNFDEVQWLRHLLEEMPATNDPRGWLDARLHALEQEANRW